MTLIVSLIAFAAGMYVGRKSPSLTDLVALADSVIARVAGWIRQIKRR